MKLDERNRYEILADGDRIWTAVNGKCCVTCNDSIRKQVAEALAGQTAELQGRL